MKTKYEYRVVMKGGAVVKCTYDKKLSGICNFIDRLIVTEDTLINMDEVAYVQSREAE